MHAVPNIESDEWQLELGRLVESSAGKVDPEIVMTLLVALAGAVGRGSGITMDAAGLVTAFNHGFDGKGGKKVPRA
jgi:hypothetical protein